MVALAEDWSRTSDKSQHAPEHNLINRVLNFRRYGFRNASLQAVVDNAIASKRPVELEPGVTYNLSEPLTYAKTEFTGINGNGAILRAVADMNCLLDVNGAANCAIQNLRLTTASDVVVQDMLLYRWDGAGRSSTRNTFENILINGRYVTGFRIGAPESTVQVDNSTFTNVVCTGGWSAGENTLWQHGFLIGSGVSSNLINFELALCQSVSNRIGYHVARARNVTLGKCMGIAAETDVLATVNNPLVVERFRSEGSGQLLKMDAGGATFEMKVAVRDSAFHPTNGVSSTLRSDGRWIEANYGGYLEITNTQCTPVPEDITPVVYVPALQRPLHLWANGLSVQRTAQAAAFDVSAKVNLTVERYTELDAEGRIVDV